MTGINYDKWTAIPNSEIDSLCRNKHVPAKVRVHWAIIRMIRGFVKNRDKEEADISYPTLANRTGADLRTVKRMVKQLEAEGEIEVNRSHGRGNRNSYKVDFNGVIKSDRALPPFE